MSEEIGDLTMNHTAATPIFLVQLYDRISVYVNGFSVIFPD